MIQKGGTLLVDVREPSEHLEWSIPGSVNIPLADLPRAKLPSAENLVVYCATGPRSVTAQQILEERGLPAAFLEGGMTAWNGVYQHVRIETGSGSAIIQIQRVGKGCLSYLVVNEGDAVAIDPTVDVHEFVHAAHSHGARIVAVLDTHAHADHASGARELTALTGAKYFAPPEVGRVPHEPILEGTCVPIGASEIRAIATPGHTPGSVTLLFEDVAFTGDTVFVDSVGRPDLGQDAARSGRTLWRTLHERILALPPTTRVLPGHQSDPDARKNAPVLSRVSELPSRIPALALDEDAFVAWIARNPLAKPANFERLKKLNVGLAPTHDIKELRTLEAGPNRCAVSG